MHKMKNVKFISAQQAKQIYHFKNIKERLYKTNALAWYNKTCRELQLTPIYISIKGKRTNHQSLVTLRIATRFHINQELKILYIKKTKSKRVS
jgi:hypothetical protein